jgi:uncharacterized protein with HEPN domain
MPLDARDAGRLTDMLHHARLAAKILGGRDLASFKVDEVAHLAVIRCIEVIGEAGHQVSAATQALLPGLPWHAMWNMRNRLIHDYGHTDLKIVHDVVAADLPELIRQTEALLAGA